MKTVYTAVPLALLAAVAQAKSQTLSSQKSSRDLGQGTGPDFMSETLEPGNVVSDTFSNGFVSHGHKQAKSEGLDDGSYNAPAFEGGSVAPGFVSSPIDSPEGGPHNFNQLDGPYTDSGHNDVEGGINNDNIIITPVISQQQQQATEADPHVIVPSHPGPPGVQHQPEALPPLQHSEPEGTIHPPVNEESKIDFHDAPAAPAAASGSSTATPPSPMPSHAMSSETPVADSTTEKAIDQAPAASQASTSSSGHLWAPSPVDSSVNPGSGEQHEELSCPQSPHTMPMGSDVTKPQAETGIEHLSSSANGNPYQPPQPPFPLPDNDWSMSGHEDHDDFSSPPNQESPDGPLFQADEEADGSEWTPSSEESHTDHPQPSAMPHKGWQSDSDATISPSNENNKHQPPASVAAAHVTQASSFAKAQAHPSTVQANALEHAPAHTSKMAEPSTLTTSATHHTAPTSTPTDAQPVAIPSTFLGGAAFAPAPGGFGLAVLGALAFLL